MKNKVSRQYRVVEITAMEQKKRMKGNEDRLRDIWDSIKGTNIHIMGSQKEKRERQGVRRYLKTL